MAFEFYRVVLSKNLDTTETTEDGGLLQYETGNRKDFMAKVVELGKQGWSIVTSTSGSGYLTYTLQREYEIAEEKSEIEI